LGRSWEEVGKKLGRSWEEVEWLLAQRVSKILYKKKQIFI